MTGLYLLKFSSYFVQKLQGMSFIEDLEKVIKLIKTIDTFLVIYEKNSEVFRDFF